MPEILSYIALGLAAIGGLMFLGQWASFVVRSAEQYQDEEPFTDD